MNKIHLPILGLALALNFFLVSAQTPEKPKQMLSLTLEEVIRLSKEQSPQAIRARHEFKSNYWEYRTYKAQRLPNFNLSATPVGLNRSIDRVVQDDGSEKYLERKSFRSDALLSLNQTVSLTGGNIFVNSGLERTDPLTSGEKIAFSASPMVSIGFQQPLNGYNAMRWAKKTEPLKYEKAKRDYVYTMENVASWGINLYFGLALAQLNLEIANTNFSNADTLYKIARGRYNIGTIAENELLQMELSKLNAETEVNRATIDLVHQKALLGSFLGYNDNVDIQIILPSTIQPPTLELASVLAAATANNPDMLSYELQLLEAQKEVARTRAERRFTANVYAQYGLNKTANDLPQAYKDPNNMQLVTVGLQIPLVDWGLGKGRFKMAQSNHEMVQSMVDQQRTEFEQNIFLKVMQFNLQNQQIRTASKADTVAQLRYEITKQRFLIGKISITDLNIALAEKDVARRGYINTLQAYFGNLFDIRKLSLFDFVENKTIIDENIEETLGL